MTRFVVRRLLVAVPILFLVSLITFSFANLAPGDPLTSLMRPGTHLAPQDVEALRQALGLDRPWPLRYVAWLQQLLLGNLGVSALTGRAVSDTLLARLPNTVLLMASALVASVLIGVSLGVLSALRPKSKLDRSLSVAVFAGISLPSYLVALLVVLVFAVLPYAAFGVRLFPATGIRDPVTSLPPVIDVMHHLILPTAVLTFGGAAIFMRYTRASVLEVMAQEHVTFARSRGLSDKTVRTNHILRNAMLPVVTVVGLSLPLLITGALFVETLFSWPGIGSLAIESTLRRDYPMIMGIGLLTAVIIILSNLLTDIAYAILDPRVRYR